MQIPSAILFDLDDTLIDRKASIDCYAIQLSKDFALQSGTRPEAIAALILSVDDRGYRPRDQVFALLQTILPWQSPPNIADIHAHWDAQFPLASVARNGAIDSLRALKAAGMPIGLISNGRPHRQHPKIDALGIRELLDCCVISGEMGIKKPDVRIFQHALAQLDCRASEAWYVGDNPRNDIQGAAAAGLTPVWLAGVCDWPQDLAPAPYVIAKIKDVLDLLKQTKY